MAEEKPKLTVENIAKLSEQIFGLPVVKITAPGGQSRESVRVHFAARTIVATQRKYPGRMRMEVEVLRRLTAENAPVPKFLSGNEQVFFQEDVGSRRLSNELLIGNEQRRLAVAERALQSLLEIREAGRRSGLAEIVPALGVEENWVRGFVGSVRQASASLKVDAPELDHDALVQKLMVPADTFVKWDSRPGNAAIGKDERVFWFDWEHCGRRQGMEDFAWMAGDEFWPFESDVVARILERILPRETAGADLEYLGHFVTFHILQRVQIIHRRFVKAGWVDAATARKYDKIGTDPDLAQRLCRHGAGWADRSALTRPMVAWFGAVSEVIERLRSAGQEKN